MTAPLRGGPGGDLEEILTVDQVCTWFQVTRDWVWDEVEAGRLPYVRLGKRHLRFRRSQLEDYLTDNTQRPASRTPRTNTSDLEPLP
jgi:excisionase family DNA binding protein